MNTNYPDGADVNPFAPWHQEEPESELINVNVTQTFSKTVEIEVDDYETIREHDEDGIYYNNGIEEGKIKANDVSVVNVTGAGDSFVAGSKTF